MASSQARRAGGPEEVALGRGSPGRWRQAGGPRPRPSTLLARGPRTRAQHPLRPQLSQGDSRRLGELRSPCARPPEWNSTPRGNCVPPKDTCSSLRPRSMMGPSLGTGSLKTLMVRMGSGRVDGAPRPRGGRAHTGTAGRAGHGASGRATAEAKDSGRERRAAGCPPNFRGHRPAHTGVSVVGPPELGDSKCLWFEAPSLWSSVP